MNSLHASLKRPHQLARILADLELLNDAAKELHPYETGPPSSDLREVLKAESVLAALVETQGVSGSALIIRCLPRG